MGFRGSFGLPDFPGTPIIIKGVIMSSIYQSCYDLIHTYIYGGQVLTSDMSLVCTLMSTIACLFCFSLPFIVCWKVIQFITGGWR